jgi:cellulose biosynthesis protein BcsQ
MVSIIAIANNKGGTSKTTTCASLAVALHELGQKPILMVDCDPTGALSTSFGISPGQDEKTLYHALLEPTTIIKQVTRQLHPGLDLVPANRELSAAEMILPTKTGGEQLLRISSLARSSARAFESRKHPPAPRRSSTTNPHTRPEASQRSRWALIGGLPREGPCAPGQDGRGRGA